MRNCSTFDEIASEPVLIFGDQSYSINRFVDNLILRLAINQSINTATKNKSTADAPAVSIKVHKDDLSSSCTLIDTGT